MLVRLYVNQTAFKNVDFFFSVKKNLGITKSIEFKTSVPCIVAKYDCHCLNVLQYTVAKFGLIKFI